MTTELFRFKETVKYAVLEDFYTKVDVTKDLEPTGVTADLQKVEEKINEYIDECEKQKWYLDTTKRSQKDAEHSEVIHTALKDIPRSLALDMRFWQWLSLCVFKKYTIFRWSLNTQDFPKEKDLKKILKKKNYETDTCLIDKNKNDQMPAFAGRLIGGSQMKSLTSIQSISRLYWMSEYLWNSNDKYELVKTAYKYQDIGQSLVERKYAMNPGVAQSFVKHIQKRYLSNENDEGLKKKIQVAAKNLNISFATVDSDYLDMNDITKLMD